MTSDNARVAVVIFEEWPTISGHAGQVRAYSAWRKAVTADGRYWLVRKRGMFRRWKWLPRRGLYLRLRLAEGV